MIDMNNPLEKLKALLDKADLIKVTYDMVHDCYWHASRVEPNGLNIDGGLYLEEGSDCKDFDVEFTPKELEMLQEVEPGKFMLCKLDEECLYQIECYAYTLLTLP